LKSATSHYLIPAEPGRGRALALAALVHFLLIIFLWFGVSWQSDTPTEVEAEIWSPVAREAAPPPPPPPLVDKPIQEPPMPVAAITPPTPPAPVVQPEPAQQKLAEPDIALEKEKKRKQDKENAARLKKEKLAEKKVLEEDQKRKKIAAAEEKQNEKKKQAEREKTKRAEDKKQKEEAIAKEKERQTEEANAQIRRDEDNKRLLNQANAGSNSGANPSQGGNVDDSYVLAVGALIKSNTRLTSLGIKQIDGNPDVQFLIKLYPDGRLDGTPIKIKSSGSNIFDDAVERAIIDSKFPKPPPKELQEIMQKGMVITQTPKDRPKR